MAKGDSQSNNQELLSIPFLNFWKWAQAHPRALVVGTLLVAALLAGPAVRKNPPAVDLAAEDVPLFI